MPVFFPPVRMPGSRELGVDGGVRNFEPLAHALRALAEFPPERDPSEVWVMQLRRPRKATTVKMLGRYLRSNFPALSISSETPAGEARSQRATGSFRVSGAIRGQYRDLRLRILQPALEFSGSVLNFDPARIRAWYEDGLRTARRLHVAEAGNPATSRQGA